MAHEDFTAVDLSSISTYGLCLDTPRVVLCFNVAGYTQL